MNRPLALLVPLVLMAAADARADAIDCFPLPCAHEAEAAKAAVNLCEHRAVRDVARLDAKLQPAKELYAAATNPTGYAIKLADRHVVRIPKWVGFAMDPERYVRAAAINHVRKELKKQVGLHAGCAAEIAADDDAPAPASEDNDL